MAEEKILSAEETKKRTCKHEVQSLKYLDTKYTPHVHKPDTMVVGQCLFLCLDCGEITVKYAQVARGFLPDGSITTMMQAEITERKNQKVIEDRVKKSLEEKAPHGN